MQTVGLRWFSNVSVMDKLQWKCLQGNSLLEKLRCVIGEKERFLLSPEQKSH